MTTSPMNAKISQKSRTESEEDKMCRAKEIWLNYFNRCIYNAGLISLDEFCKMTALIAKSTKRMRNEIAVKQFDFW